MKRELDQPYAFEGKVYGPGETELPNDILDKEYLSPAFREAIGGSEASSEAPELTVPEDAGREELLAADYISDDEVRRASDDELLAVDRIGATKLKRIRAYLEQ